MLPSDEILTQYKALSDSCGYHRFTSRTILELTGADRAKFLNNFSTADIKRLQPGQGTEAFLTSVQGKIVGYLYVFLGGEQIVLENAAGQAAALLPHLGKYIILDDAELHDRSDDWSTILVAGANASTVLSNAFEAAVPEGMYDNVSVEIAGRAFTLARVPLTGPECFLLMGDHVSADVICQQLDQADVLQCSSEAVEMRRVEAGIPQAISEVTDANLPQEVARDSQAISFTKGCYLGQETVARIDALGHVNRYLRLVKFSGDAVPPASWEHAVDGKSILKVTSSAYSPALNSPLALAYIRRGNEKIGTTFETEFGAAEVIAPPGSV